METKNALSTLFSTLIITALMLSAMPAQPVYAASIIVDTNADNTTASDNFCTLREAINNANDVTGADTTGGDCAIGSIGSDTITVPAGTYTLSSELLTTTDMNINGAGAATTIIQANANPNTATYRVLRNNGGTITLSGLTFRHGRCNGSCDGPLDGGGGIINQAGNLTLDASTVSSNYATYGGGIYNQSGTLTVSNSTFAGNSATTIGGGIYNQSGTLTVSNSTFANNSATSGGGIESYGALLVTSSTFSDNSATGDGGGAILHADTLIVTNSTFSDNSANNNFGGAIFKAGGIVTAVTNSTFYNNSATNGGGGIYKGGNTVDLAGNIFDAGPIGSDQCSGSMIDNGYNLSSDASCGFSGTSADSATLNLGALSGGGPGQQVHTPGAGSDAIGVIPNGTTITNNTVSWTCDQSGFTDQLGANRPIISGDACASGAVEVAQSAKLTIVKEASPEDGTDFAFTSNITGGANFTLDDATPDDSDSVDQSITFNNLTAGTYTITEDIDSLSLPSGWQLDDTTTCTGGSDTGTLITYKTLSVALSAGEDMTCTFRNSFNSITIKKSLLSGSLALGQDITWELEVENTGASTIENVEITDVLGTGFTFDNASQSGNNAGQTTTWTSNEYAALTSMNPGDILTMTITATISACTDLVNKADTRFGYNPSPANTIFDTAVDGRTASVGPYSISCSDLKVTKTNNVSGTADLDQGPTSWTWSLEVENTGTEDAVFNDGETIISDNLPNTNVVYSSLSNPAAVGGGTTGTVACSIASYTLVCTASGGTVTIPANGTVTATVTATPSNDAIYANPRSSGSCTVDPTGRIAEADETNNTCSNSVTVTAPDLTATKTDDVSSSPSVGIPFTWAITVANTAGSSDAIFTNGEVILTDNLDNSGNASYVSPATITNVTDVTNDDHITCTIASSNLTCTVTGAGPVTIQSGTGTFDVEITTTLLAAGGFDNPRSTGICRVDPNTLITEGSEVNNDCSDTVTGNVADFRPDKGSSVGNSTTLGNSWEWSTRVYNDGPGDAFLAQNTVIFVDDLPNTNISYSGVGTSDVTGITSSNSGSITCTEASETITCTVTGGDITFAASGYFDVDITGTPTAAGVYTNPRSGGSCAADPNNAYTQEGDESNNDCTHTVTITASDLQVTKSGPGPGSVMPNGNFDWVLTITNAGTADAVFAQNDVILNDDMPVAATYAAPTIGYSAGLGATDTIACSTPTPTNLSCTADNAAGLTIPAGESITVTVGVTAPNSPTILVNPEAGTCAVDPDNNNTESDETNNSCTDTVAVGTGPVVLFSANTIPANGATLTTGPAQLFIEFDKDLDPTSAQTLANYLLLEEGSVAAFQTADCDAAINGAGVDPDDLVITIESAAYSNAGGTYLVTLGINAGNPLPIGRYQLYLCGTTSIEDTFGLELNDGLIDTQLNFTVTTASSLPATGFRHGEITQLPKQPAAKTYTDTAMTLEIPKLSVSMPIVGVPQTQNGWDVTWLGNGAGYLAGSAFPTWAGNTVITGHVWDSFNQPGAFAEIKSLKYGDQVQIQAWGLTYTYEVRESKLVTVKNVDAAFQSEEYDWLTLVTCEFYNPFSRDYLFRRAVRAVLVDVK